MITLTLCFLCKAALILEPSGSICEHTLGAAGITPVANTTAES